MSNQINLETTVTRMKAEILRDIAVGHVSGAVESFGELHDYVDANYYGGFTEDSGITDKLIAQFGGRDASGDIPPQVLDFFNAAQDAVDSWLRTGRVA